MSEFKKHARDRDTIKLKASLNLNSDRSITKLACMRMSHEGRKESMS